MAASLAVSALAPACTGGGPAPTPTPDKVRVAAQVASIDLYVKVPQRVLIGLIASDNRLVGYGTLDFTFSYFGPDGSGAPVAGPTATASYIAAPGTGQGGGTTPALVNPSETRGVYQAENVTFDQPGIWEVTVTGNVQGAGPQTLTSNFAVQASPQLPAPSQKALKTENLTMSSKGVPLSAVDSWANATTPIPDAILHRSTIADALARHDPILVIFATPTYCTSRFCGPATDAVAALATRYPKNAVYIHIEIWRDYTKQVINKAAADWLYRNNGLTEPWLYLIDGHGTIVDRWGSVFDPTEVAKELSTLHLPGP